MKDQERRKRLYSNCGYHSTFTAKRQNNADASILQLVPGVALRLVLEFLLEVLDKFGEIGFCILISHAVPGVASEIAARHSSGSGIPLFSRLVRDGSGGIP